MSPLDSQESGQEESAQEEVYDPEKYTIIFNDILETNLRRFDATTPPFLVKRLSHFMDFCTEVRILVRYLGIRLTTEERELANKWFGASIYELAHIGIMSTNPEIREPIKPFSLSMTCPRIAGEENGLINKKIINTTPKNLLEAHQRIVNRKDIQTTSITEFIRGRGQSTVSPIPTELSLVMEIQTTQAELEKIKTMTTRVNSNPNYNLILRPLDLSTALQLAIQRYGALTRTKGIGSLLSTARGPNGKQIAVLATLENGILLKEVDGPEEASTIIKTTDKPMPVSTHIIERPLRPRVASARADELIN